MERGNDRNEENKKRLEKDINFFKQQLKKEKNQFMRNMLLSQIRDVRQQQYNILQAERRQAERENQNLKEALEMALAKRMKEEEEKKE